LGLHYSLALLQWTVYGLAMTDNKSNHFRQ
jgi:hypothetical protein